METASKWPLYCRNCRRLGCTCAVVAGVLVAGWASATCEGGTCNSADLGRIPMPQYVVTSTSTAGPSDAVSLYNNITDEELEFAVYNAKRFQRYDAGALLISSTAAST